LQLICISLGSANDLSTSAGFRVMLTPVRILFYMFCAPGVIAMAYLFYLHGTYSERMPREPQPALGRTHLVYAIHTRLYVTEAEAARLNGA
jgi:hypothetical protein